MKKRIVVGMSGGVDSSVAAALLKAQGHEVIGIFMKNWEETDQSGHCTTEQDYADVVKVCEHLDIPYYAVNFAKEYWDGVFQEFLQGLQAGRTPNPDILCNREIKFKVFYDHAMKLGCDAFATGHYCQIGQVDGEYQLLKGFDGNKDQTYFLHAIDRQCLEKTLFPIGHLIKPDVRKIAAELNLPTKEKKDSTGICFIGERNFNNFIQNYLKPNPGNYCTLDGVVVGTHQGHQFHTIGQRKGLGLGGQGDPWFVVAKDPATNQVFVERGEHPALYRPALLARDLNFLGLAGELQFPLRCKAKIRYRQPDQDCVIEGELMVEGQRYLKVVFDRPQRAITPEQSIVFYQGERCLGGALIDRALVAEIAESAINPESSL
jgi:tRNA-specific 2-thiouridylase